MDKFIVKGPSTLKGTISVSGSKNGALPLLFASLLSDKTNYLSNVPQLQDMESALKMLLYMGVKVDRKYSTEFGSDWVIDSSHITENHAPYDLVRKMRASFFCLGPLLARSGKAKVSLPGGCAIGARPVDLHIDALKSLGAEVNQESGYIEAIATGGRLSGGKVVFPKVSVGASENAIMAAVLAKGGSKIENVAREPEILYLCEALTQMGAKISGAGSSVIEIEGVDSLKGLNYAIPADRIETATYLIAAQCAGGDITLENTRSQDIQIILSLLKESGATITETNNSIRVQGSSEITPVDITTAPYPGFPTDAQAQWVTMMTQASGTCLVTEKIFENRMMHVPELIRMGADITMSGNSLKIKGNRGNLQGAPVMATDLRASASLVLAGTMAHGETHVKRIYHLDRGYESMEAKLRNLGADVERAADT